MLTVETIRKIIDGHHQQTNGVKEYLFMGQRTGELNGLKDNQLLSNGTVQVIFTKRLEV